MAEEKRQTAKSKKKKGKNKNRRKWIVLGVLVGYLMIMFLGYVGAAFYFSSHFLKGTTVNGIDVANKTVSEVKELIQDEINSYKLRITELDGKTETITATQLELTYVDDNAVDELMKEQNHWKWITAFSSDATYTLAATTTYDEELLTQALDDMSAFQEENIVAPQDAYLQENATSYEIVEEVEGNTLDRDKVEAAVKNAIETGETEINLVDLDCYVKPEITSDNEALVAECNTLNTYLSTDLTYDFGDRTETVDASVVKEWLVKDDEGNWGLDEDLVSAFVQELANKYDTFGLTHEFTTTAGDTITLEGGDYGWVIKKEDTKNALIEAVTAGQTGTIEPVYLYEAKSRDTNDIGGTYIEISIEDQHMWCYKDFELVIDTDVVTGNPNKGNATPSGSVWAIDGMKQDATLTGEGYSTPVNYWMPFNGNVGIHDADTWRSEYGGDIYLTSGSHGCVNTPLAAVEIIFNTVEIGTPVIVY